tara:strand:- start:2866 stop:3045 length:180 start_codon:yes stop_codon:yes gene_type:complete
MHFPKTAMRIPAKRGKKRIRIGMVMIYIFFNIWFKVLIPQKLRPIVTDETFQIKVAKVK